jgi:hypothetical protein
MGASPSRRARLREKARLEAIETKQRHDDLRQRGFSCRTCSHFQLLAKSKTVRHCELEYDHHGGWETHMPVSPTDVCDRHSKITLSKVSA